MYLLFEKRGLATCLAFAFLICAALLNCTAQTNPVANVPHPRLAHSVSEGDDRKPHVGGQKHLRQAPPEAAAQPARIILKDGILTIAANNSDLAQILRDLSDKSGMAVHGLSKSPRIFGVYGPGDSREVLWSLLAGSGYNFILVGGAYNGVPRELTLTPIAAAIPVDPPQLSERAVSGLPEQQQTNSEEPGPGAVFPLPPPATADESTRVEQNLQRLQHLEERRNDPQ